MNWNAPCRLTPDKKEMKANKAKKTMPPTGNRSGALAGSTSAAEPDDQSEGAVQPAFSAISRPCIKELECMNTSSWMD